MDIDNKKKSSKNNKRKSLKTRNYLKKAIIIATISLAFGFLGGIFSLRYYSNIVNLFPGIFSEISNPFSSDDSTGSSIIERKITTNEQEAVINVVNQSINSVVSILAEGEIPLDNYPFFSQKISGAGSGFIVSSDGLILTNKHVAEYEDINYTVILQDGEKYEAQLLALDPIQDLAILKIKKQGLQPLALGNSEDLQIGQTVIAIGNALGEFQNTVSVGVVSGLSREITAGGGGTIETIEEVIQTDTAINQGNSGGPLLDLSGKVIGINTAMASGAENIGFAIPIDKAKKAINDVKEKGKIVYPFLGVRYVLISDALQTTYDLSVNYGALIIGDEEGAPAVVPGSSADKAGIKANDIILEIDGQKITEENTLSEIILAHDIGDKIKLKILRKDKQINITAELTEWTQ